MARDVSLAYRIATMFDAAGINKADKSIKGFDKNLKKLGKTLGVTLSAAAVVEFGKRAAQAFIQDEKEATRLATAVKNLGLEFENRAIADYIDRLELASGVSDGLLRPALQALLTTTGSLTTSQQLLNQAIDVSAGTGIELTTVSQDLANAYVGITKGLKKYNLGLTQAELKSATFTEIQAKLNKQFSGANAAFLDTYAGKLARLSSAASQAQENIGQAVIDLAMAVTGASDVEDLIDKIGKAADFAVARIDDFIEGFRILKLITTKNFWKQAFNPNGTISPEIAKIQAEEFNRRMKRDYMKAWAGVDIPLTPEQQRAKAAAEAAAKKRAAALLAAQNKNTAELKKQAALKKAGTVFDLEQIQLIAALKGKLSAEERTRVEAQLAILNQNDVLAQQLTKQILMAQDATGGLYQYFLAIGDAKIKNPFAFLDQWILDFQAKLNALKFPTINPQTGALTNVSIGAQGGIGNTTISPTISSNSAIQGTFNKVLLDQLAAGASDTQAATLALSSARYEAAAQQYANMSAPINITVQGSIIREQELIDQVLAGTQLSSLSGSPSQIGRIAGMFGP
jgi:hypothetical protein